MLPGTGLNDEIEYHISQNDGIRIVALSIETRPDLIDIETIKRYNSYFITFVEMGVQTTNDKILKRVNRGHTTAHSEMALSLLKSQAGFIHPIIQKLMHLSVGRSPPMLQDPVAINMG